MYLRIHFESFFFFYAETSLTETAARLRFCSFAWPLSFLEVRYMKGNSAWAISQIIKSLWIARINLSSILFSTDCSWSEEAQKVKSSEPVCHQHVSLIVLYSYTVRTQTETLQGTVWQIADSHKPKKGKSTFVKTVGEETSSTFSLAFHFPKSQTDNWIFKWKIKAIQFDYQLHGAIKEITETSENEINKVFSQQQHLWSFVAQDWSLTERPRGTYKCERAAAPRWKPAYLRSKSPLCKYQLEKPTVQQIKNHKHVWRNNLTATEAALHLSSPP